MQDDRQTLNEHQPVTGAQFAALTSRLEAMHLATIERIKEVRADVAGTAELNDMASGEVLDKIGDLLSQVTARAPTDDVGGPGSEIEAVIRLNAEAANRIMDAAEHISTCIEVDGVPAEVRFTVLNHVTAIFEACGFQDLTGQRITRALKTLRSIEESMLGRQITEVQSHNKIDQAYADSVLSGTHPDAHKEVSQADIDSLFG